MRHDGRRDDELRALDVIPDFLEQPHGCVLWTQGKTRVLCTAMVEEEIPRWLRLRLESFRDDTASIRSYGLDVVTRLCDDLLRAGAPGLSSFPSPSGSKA